jgi:hypothetical protein
LVLVVEAASIRPQLLAALPLLSAQQQFRLLEAVRAAQATVAALPVLALAAT